MQLKSLNIFKKYKEIFIFGASNAANEVENFAKMNNQNIIGYIDNDFKKKGTLYKDKNVYHPNEIKDILKDNQAIIIASAYQQEIAIQLVEELGISPIKVYPYINKMFSKHFDNAFYMKNIENIEYLYEKLCDIESRKYLDSIIDFRCNLDARYLFKNPKIQGFYFYCNPNIGPFENDTIIDVGAYNGDSALSYMKKLNNKAHILALEPFKENYKVLVDNILSQKLIHLIKPLNVAAGSTLGTCYIESKNTNMENPRIKIQSNVKSKSHNTNVDTIDNLVKIESKKIDFIKIDVEGLEPDVIIGSTQTIKKYKPGFAIAAYHEPDHIWSLIQLIENIEPNYSYFLGHHPTAIYECEIYAFHNSKMRI